MRVFTRRQPSDRDDELPSRERVAEELDGDADLASGDHADDERQLELLAFRPSLRRSAAVVAAALFGVGLVLFVPFVVATPFGRAALEARGFLALAGSWIVMVLIIVAGGLIALTGVRALSSVLRRARRTDVLKLALGEAAVTAAGATFAAALVSGALNDLIRVLAITFVLTFLFTWAMLFPLYRRAWDEAAAQGRDA